MDQGHNMDDYQHRIRERARQLWEEAGRPEGQDDDFWYAAERAYAADNPGMMPPRADDPQPETMGDPTVLSADNS